MSDWTTDELTRMTRADELRIAGRRSDGSLRKPVVIWMVTLDGELYVRSVNGPDAAWFRGTQVAGLGHITSGGVDKDVAFTRVTDLHDALDAAYAAKYPQYRSAVESINSATARTTTLRVDPVAHD
jgi:hypothetical protein